MLYDLNNMQCVVCTFPQFGKGLSFVNWEGVKRSENKSRFYITKREDLTRLTILAQIKIKTGVGQVSFIQEDLEQRLLSNELLSYDAVLNDSLD